MWRRQATKDNQIELQSLAARARSGDLQAREQLLSALSTFALNVARKVSGRYIDIKDEEYSIALLAINETIDSHDISRGASLTTLGETVIRRRLIDHMRRQSRIKEVPRSSLAQTLEGEEYDDIPAEVTAAEDLYREQQLAHDRRLEIEALSKELAGYGLTFADLPAQTPKHADARETALRIAATLVSDGVLWEDCRRRKLLPVAALCEKQMVSRKTVERHRKYIIAVALILGGDYPLLRQFVGVKRSG